MKAIIAALTLVISANAAMALPSLSHVTEHLRVTSNAAALTPWDVVHSDNIRTLHRMGVITDAQADTFYRVHLRSQVVALQTEIRRSWTAWADLNTKIWTANQVADTVAAPPLQRQTAAFNASSASVDNDAGIYNFGNHIYAYRRGHGTSNTTYLHQLTYSEVNALATLLDTHVDQMRADAYNEGYEDGYRDGYADGVRDTKAALQ